MPVYFTGQTGPALPLTSVQVNTGGIFAGDANFTWVPESGLTSLKRGSFGADSIINYQGSPTVLSVSEIFTGTSGFLSGINVEAQVRPSANSAAGYFGLKASAYANDAGNTRSITELSGIEGFAEQDGSGSVTNMYGLKFRVYQGGAGVVTSAYGTDLAVINFGAGIINNAYGVFSFLDNDGGGGIGTGYHYYATDLSGAVTTGYYSWFDSQGVLRVKEDNTFNSVGQAIQALYNPQFTKYTPGLANYERIVLGQWSSNVAQIGIEAGGTGTLRAMDFIGASVGFPLSATNGQNFAIKILTELTTIAAAATTDTAIQIPANAVVFGVDVRVTVAIPTAATFTVIGAGSATVFNTVAVTVAANSTDKGTKSCPFYNATVQAIRITPDIQPGANSGRVRVTIHYYEVTAATS